MNSACNLIMSRSPLHEVNENHPKVSNRIQLFSLFPITDRCSYLYLEHSATTDQNNDRNHTLSISEILF